MQWLQYMLCWTYYRAISLPLLVSFCRWLELQWVPGTFGGSLVSWQPMLKKEVTNDYIQSHALLFNSKYASIIQLHNKNDSHNYVSVCFVVPLWKVLLCSYWYGYCSCWFGLFHSILYNTEWVGIPRYAPWSLLPDWLVPRIVGWADSLLEQIY